MRAAYIHVCQSVTVGIDGTFGYSPGMVCIDAGEDLKERYISS
jgi:hypothetical protein